MFTVLCLAFTLGKTLLSPWFFFLLQNRSFLRKPTPLEATGRRDAFPKTLPPGSPRQTSGCPAEAQKILRGFMTDDGRGEPKAAAARGKKEKRHRRPVPSFSSCLLTTAAAAASRQWSPNRSCQRAALCREHRGRCTAPLSAGLDRISPTVFARH